MTMPALQAMRPHQWVKNLLVLALAIPVHGVCALLCARDPRIFELLQLWMRTHAVALLANGRHWRGASYSPLSFSPPSIAGRRSAPPAVV